MQHSSSYQRAFTANQRFNFGGKEEDDFTGWNDHHARQYDPVLGRFTTIDPLSEIKPDWTTYRFGFNNPMRYNDPTGLYEGEAGSWSADDEEFAAVLQYWGVGQNNDEESNENSDSGDESSSEFTDILGHSDEFANSMERRLSGKNQRKKTNNGDENNDEKKPIKGMPKGKVVFTQRIGNGVIIYGIEDPVTKQVNYYKRYSSPDGIPTPESPILRGTFNFFARASFIPPNIMTGGQLGFEGIGDDHFKNAVWWLNYHDYYYPIETPENIEK